MKNYTKNPAVDRLFVPGIGEVKTGQVISGSFDRFVPQYLVETPAVDTVTAAPTLLTEPAPSISPTIPASPPPMAASIPESRLFEVIGDAEEKQGVQVLVEDGQTVDEPVLGVTDAPEKRKPGRPKGTGKS